MDGWVVHESGLEHLDLRGSDGAVVREGDVVTVHYDVHSPSGLNEREMGDRIESSWATESPVRFRVGVGEVLNGIDEGVVGMGVAGERLLRLPPALAYGTRGQKDLVAGDATLLVKLYVVTREVAPQGDAIEEGVE